MDSTFFICKLSCVVPSARNCEKWWSRYHIFPDLNHIILLFHASLLPFRFLTSNFSSCSSSGTSLLNHYEILFSTSKAKSQYSQVTLSSWLLSPHNLRFTVSLKLEASYSLVQTTNVFYLFPSCTDLTSFNKPIIYVFIILILMLCSSTFLFSCSFKNLYEIKFDSNSALTFLNAEIFSTPSDALNREVPSLPVRSLTRSTVCVLIYRPSRVDKHSDWTFRET